MFDCHGSRLIGIVHTGVDQSDVAYVFVVGGPQYRVGSHRMFVELARSLAAVGYPTLRFDCRGMGDSDGVFTSFEQLSDDIRCAVDCALKTTGARRAVLFGLCDGASAIAMYGHLDPRVCGLVLLNPWVRTEAGEAKARVRHYYGVRVLQREFWRRLVTGEIKIMESALSLWQNLRSAGRSVEADASYVDKMRIALSAYRGRILCLLSQHDLVAQEFAALVRSSRRWKQLMAAGDIQQESLVNADHTLSGIGQMSGVVATIGRWCQGEYRH